MRYILSLLAGVTFLSHSAEVYRTENSVVNANAYIEYSVMTGHDPTESPYISDSKDRDILGVSGVYVYDINTAFLGSVMRDTTKDKWEHHFAGVNISDTNTSWTVLYGKQPSIYDVQAGKGDYSYKLGGVTVGGELGGGITDNTIRSTLVENRLAFGVSHSFGYKSIDNITAFAARYAFDDVTVSIGYLSGLSFTKKGYDNIDIDRKYKLSSTAYQTGIAYTKDKLSLGASIEKANIGRWNVLSYEVGVRYFVSDKMSFASTYGNRDATFKKTQSDISTNQITFGTGYKVHPNAELYAEVRQDFYGRYSASAIGTKIYF
ncbi:hypothetical protein NVP2275O_271 [Vibrio phage 2.275.O._10N.286.54.E11]|nr:hypothetical protein NVP2275O_271 [Vibrio phage 2.275.O._10N.286.54.E11]